MNVYQELALLLLAAALAGLLAVRLRQPLLIAYIVVGIIAGPMLLGLISATDQLHLLAEIGVTILLFVVGLKLDMKLIRHLGPVALATGLGQLGFTILFGFLLSIAMGMAWIKAFYVAVALTFSSTIIIVKLLSDKREIDSLHGRIAMGFLIVQDIAVVVAMTVMGSLRGAEGDTQLLEVGLSVGIRLLLALLAIGLLMRYVLPAVAHWLARSQELLLVFAVGWGTALAAAGELLGFSKEVGAFLAGLSLASTHYREVLSARLNGVRDFLLPFFFINLGASLDLTTLGDELLAAVVLSLFVLIGNPLIVMAIMGYMGYRARTGFLAGLTVAQISEFSIIFVAMGIASGHVGADALGLVTLVGLVTITLSTYMILYSHALYRRLAPWLTLFERRTPHREPTAADADSTPDEIDALVIGLGRYGRRLLEGLRARGLRVAAVDFDPEVVAALRNRGQTVFFGDIADIDFLETLPLHHTRWIVCTLPPRALNETLLQSLKLLDYRGAVAVTAHLDDTEPLRRAGADHVLQPFHDAAEHAAGQIAGLVPGSSDNRPILIPK